MSYAAPLITRIKRFGVAACTAGADFSTADYRIESAIGPGNVGCSADEGLIYRTAAGSS